MRFLSLLIIVLLSSFSDQSFAQSSEEELLETLFNYRNSLDRALSEGNQNVVQVVQNPSDYLPILSSWLVFPADTSLLDYANLIPRNLSIISVLQLINTQESRSILESAYQVVAPHVEVLNEQFRAEMNKGTPSLQLDNLERSTSAAEQIYNRILLALTHLDHDAVLNDVLNRISHSSAFVRGAMVQYINNTSTQEYLSHLLVLPNSWNLIGMPLAPSVNSTNSVFTDLILKNAPLTWSSNQYSASPSIEMGKAYWASPKYQGDSQTIVGTNLTSLTWSLTLGWNMVSGPSCDLHVNALSDPGNIVVSGSLQSFDNGYQQDSTLIQGEGYWIQTTADGQVSLNCNAASKTTSPELSLPPVALGRLIVKDAARGSQQLYFGSTLSDDHAVSYSMPPRPPAGVFDARFADNTRLIEDSSAEVRIQSSNYPVTVVLERAPDGATRFVLEELALGQVVATHLLDTPVDITNTNVTAFRIRPE